jgi:predicted DNA-binding transcriptional regulator YafY
MRADRLLSLLMLLQNHPQLTAAEAAQRLGVSVRTIQRDVDALSAGGVPVYAERGRGGGLRLVGGYSTRLTGLSPAEAEALALVSAPSVVGDLALTAPLDAALEKIAAAIPAVHQVRARHARNRLMVDTLPWFREAAPEGAVQMLEMLRQAVWSDAVCALDYERGDGVRRDYRVNAYALVAKIDLWYLVAETSNGMRVFRVSRMLHGRLTGERFDRAPDFELARFWRAWCYRFETQPINRYWVTVALTATARDTLLATYHGWHARALADWDDSLTWNTVTLDLEREDIAARVLFDIAGEARVLEPSGLVELMRARANSLLTNSL